MKSRFIVLAALLLLLLSSCSLAEDITPPPNYQSPTPAPTMSPLFPAVAPNLASGAAIFAEECAPCHGEKGLGDGPAAAQLQNPPVALGKPEIARAAAPANWYTTVTQGNMKAFMPPFNAKLSDAQRWDVVAYALSLGTTPAEIAKGKTIYEAKCLDCHGPDGKANAQADFTNQAMLAKLTQNDIASFVNKGIGTMRGFGGLIPDADIYAAAAYVRTFSVSTEQVAAAATATPQPAGTPNPESTPTAEGTPAAAGTPVETSGEINGKVINGSGGTVPASLKAVLHIFEHDTATQQFSEVGTQEAPVDAASGSYSFKDLSMPQNRAFYVSVDYAETTYESAPAIPAQDPKAVYDLPVTIYETTSDTSTLSAKQVHLILDYSKPDLVQVVEFFIITNTGTKTVVAAEKGGPIVKITLPQGYTNLQFEQGAIGERFLKTTEGFADTTAVPPAASQYQVVFAFDLPMPKAGLFGASPLEFSQPLSLPIEAASILVPEGLSLKADGFAAGKTQDMGNGVQYQIYSSGPLEMGKVVQVSVSGTPKTSAPVATPGADTTQNIIYGVGALGLVLILIGGWLYWRDRQRRTALDEDEDLDETADEEAPAEDTDEIMDAIVALDDQFKAGNLSEAAYQERRAELKAKLKANL
jgi:mono/diheme cytochrome c family protein